MLLERFDFAPEFALAKLFEHGIERPLKALKNRRHKARREACCDPW